MFPGRFLKNGLLKKPITIKIVRVYKQRSKGGGGKDSLMHVVEFEPVEGFEQVEWTTNKVNGICMREMFGPSVSKDWIGKRVTLHRSQVEQGAERGSPCIRVLGSPDIDGDMKIVVDVGSPFWKPFPMTLRGGKKREDAQLQPSHRCSEIEDLVARAASSGLLESAIKPAIKEAHAKGEVTDPEFELLKLRYKERLKVLVAFEAMQTEPEDDIPY